MPSGVASSVKKKSRGFDGFELLQLAPLAPLVPVGAALVHFAAQPRRWSRPMRWGLAAATALGALNVLRWQLHRFAVPKPRYEVLACLGDLEIRRYGPLVVAETEVEGGFDAALDEGFGRLAAFISGENSPPMQPYESEELRMTAPVTAGQSTGGLRTIGFVMPLGRGLDGLPKPYDPRIRLREQPARIVGALKFHGCYDAEHVQRAERELVGLITAKGLKAKGPPQFAAYDSPAILPALRRNEIWVELDA